MLIDCSSYLDGSLKSYSPSPGKSPFLGQAARADFGHSIIAESPVESAEIMVLESAPPQYQIRVVSGLPKGSGCSQFNGYEIRRTTSNEIEVAITHHEVADPMAICTTDFPIVETNIPLGSDFESGEKYTVRVNSDTVTSFVAQ